MKTPNPQHIARVCELVSQSPFPNLISIALTDLTPGGAVFETEIAPKHFQPFKVVHGGLIASLIDSVSFWATYLSVEDENDGLTSIDLKLNYLSPVMKGAHRLIAKGREIKTGRRLAYAEATVSSDDGSLIAHGTSTLMILPGRGLNTQTPLPPKFL